MNRHPLIVARRDVHRNVARRAEAKTGAGRVELTGEWKVQTARRVKCEELVAADAREFLTRMNVKVAESGAKTVLLEMGSCEKGFRAVIEDNRIQVHGADAAGLWAGWVWLENAMREAGGPFLSKGEISREPAWAVQIAPPTWGANYAVPDLSEEFVGDDAFRSLAHAGADGMFIYGDFLLYANDTHLSELNDPKAGERLDVLKRAAERASGYGVKLYFVLVSPKLAADHPVFKKWPGARGALIRHEAGSTAPPIHCLCSSDPDALAFHAEAVGGIFKAVPEMGGVIAIIGGESYYHCFMRAAGAGIGTTNCSKCNGKRAEDVIAKFLKVTAEGVHQHAPAAKVMAWPYSAQYFWSAERDQLKLIDALPEKVALLSEIDKEELLHKDGYTKLCWDYSVEMDHASDRIVAQAERCVQRDRELFIKTETSHGIELLHLPWVPSVQRSGRLWQSIRALRPAGVLQRWGFIGMFDSAAERLGYLARWDSEFAAEASSDCVARQLVGSAAPQVAQAWKKFDLAVGHLPSLTSGPYYVGPLFLGPGCPLPVWEGKTPDAFLGNFFYLAEAEMTGSNERQKVKDDFVLHSTAALGASGTAATPETQEREYARGRDLAKEGYEILRRIERAKMDDVTRAEIDEQQAIGEYLYRTLRTCANVIGFLRRREAGAKKAELIDIARDELENAREAKAMWERAPWLNHSLRLDVGAPESLAMAAEKIRQLGTFIGA